MYLCPSYWNKEGLNQRIKIKVYKHDVLCFVCTLQPKYQGAHVRETLQGVTSFSQGPTCPHPNRFSPVRFLFVSDFVCGSGSSCHFH